MINRVKIYLDTSVFGGFFDEEFAEHTKPLFDKIENGQFTMLISDLTQRELTTAPQQVRNLVLHLKYEMTQLIQTSDEAIDLANEYIVQKVVGQTNYSDCLHIALATINKADYLVSWNFKHIVNVQRIRGYNGINLRNGYSLLEIRSPREFTF